MISKSERRYRPTSTAFHMLLWSSTAWMTWSWRASSLLRAAYYHASLPMSFFCGGRRRDSNTSVDLSDQAHHMLPYSRRRRVTVEQNSVVASLTVLKIQVSCYYWLNWQYCHFSSARGSLNFSTQITNNLGYESVIQHGEPTRISRMLHSAGIFDR